MPYNAFSSGLNFPASLVLLVVAVAAVARFFCSLFWFILFAYSTPAYQSNEGGERNWLLDTDSDLGVAFDGRLSMPGNKRKMLKNVYSFDS